jgi:hypothetical protein
LFVWRPFEGGKKFWYWLLLEQLVCFNATLVWMCVLICNGLVVAFVVLLLLVIANKWEIQNISKWRRLIFQVVRHCDSLFFWFSISWFHSLQIMQFSLNFFWGFATSLLIFRKVNKSGCL